MTNYREILRLHSLGLNNTQVAETCGCSRTTVVQTLRLAKEKSLSFPLPPEMSDKQLAETLFPPAAGKIHYKMPDYEYVYKELQKKGVTLNLLWLEYCDRCRDNGEVEVFFAGNRICSHMRLCGKPNQYSTIETHMPPEHQKYTQWNGERFIKWAAKIGTNTETVIKAILSGYKVEQQGYKTCMGI